jgi:3-hydroxyacyl-[acyl-carrier-protein] dehydratase
MPPQFLFDLAAIDLKHILYDRDVIRQYNPQRGQMEHLDAIVHVNEPGAQLLGYKDVRDDEFWVAGHIPGRPLLPGVVMLECGAQLASFYTRKVSGWTGFVGFGGVEDCKFRKQVIPGQRMYILGQKIWERHRRLGCKVQGVVEGEIAFEATIVGAQL